MTRLFKLIAALIALASPAFAQEVTVRSGEHAGFTRLVFNVPPDTGWVLTHRKNGARLSVDLEAATFQTNAVFGRLTTNRLAAMSQKKPGDGLDLEFGCDCVASAFLYRKSMIVLDIAPGTALPSLLADIPPPRPDPQKKPERQDPVTSFELPLLSMNGQAFKDQLSTRLLQGADREVLDLNLAGIGPRRSPDLLALPMIDGLQSNVQLSTVLDDLNAILGAEFPQIHAKPACFTTVELGFETWSDSRPFQEQVAQLRAGLFKEFDDLDEDRAMALARLYAFHGFGAEAVQMLKMLADQNSDADRVQAIAHIVDNRPMPATSPFQGLQRCDSDAALWAALAEQQLAPDARVEAIEQSFARLPDHLRRSFGPRLSSILVNAEELEAARRILRSVDRVEDATTPALSHARAKVAEAEGDMTAEEEHLSQVITAPDAPDEAALALARLVEKRWTDRGAVSPQELELAAAYATELRQSEMGPMMTRTHAVALALTQEFDAAFDLIDTLPDGSDAPAVLDRHLQLLAERADDVTFLRQVLTLSGDQADGVSTPTAIALSERLMGLGFRSRAFAFANRDQDRARRSERARLRARAVLQNNRPHQAMLELADDSSDEASALRARALEASQEFAKAAEVLSELGDLQAANRYFWLADLLEKTDANAVGKYVKLSETTQALRNPPERLADKPLADAANLLNDSIEARQQISTLLNAVESE